MALQFYKLPWPPSNDRMYRVFNGRSILSSEAREYYKLVVPLLSIFHKRQLIQFQLETKKPLKAVVYIYPPDNRRRDMDNLLKASQDVLVRANVIYDDSLIQRLYLDKKHVSKPAYIMFGIGYKS